jgi:NodT family efflux transporter outer membrane factor (OMF) lipoprotein
MRFINLIALILCALKISSCHLISPSNQMREAPCFSSQEAQDAPFEEVEQIPEAWWKMFEDPALNSLMAQALAYHPSISAAQNRIRRSCYLVQEARSLLLPNLSFTANVQKQKLSKTAIPPASSLTNKNFTATGAPPFNFTQYELYFNFLYDFDIWGKNCTILKAAIGEYQARIAEAALAHLALSISLAEAYFAWQEDAQHLVLIQKLIENQKRILFLTEKRLQYNLASAFELAAAAKDLAALEARRVEVATDLALRKHQVQAYVAGDFDEEWEPVSLYPAALRRFPLPSNLPLHLIAKRPDIAAQRWLIESAFRQMEAAKAEFYPDLNLMAMLGLSTIHLKDLFKDKSGIVLIEPALNLPLYTGGFLEAQHNASVVDYDLAIDQYNQLVLNAVQEVLDGISALKLAHEQLEWIHSEASSENVRYQLTKQKLTYALGDELELLASEQALLLIQAQEVSALGISLHAMLGLMKALGGGYDGC